MRAEDAFEEVLGRGRTRMPALGAQSWRSIVSICHARHRCTVPRDQKKRTCGRKLSLPHVTIGVAAGPAAERKRKERMG